MSDRYDLTRLAPPQSLEAEQRVLGSMMIDASAAREVRAMLQSADFYLTAHGTVFDALGNLIDRSAPTDPLAVAAELGSQEALDQIGGRAYLLKLVDSVATASEAAHFAGIVAQKAMQRREIELGEYLIARGYDDEHPVSAGLEQAQDQLWQLQQRLRERQQTAPQKFSALWGREFESVRWIVDGLIPEGFVLLVAPPKRGKSILTNAIAVAAASGGAVFGRFTCDPCEVLYLALEDSERRLQDRTRRVMAGEEPTPEMLERLYYATSWPRFGAEGGLLSLDRWLKAHRSCRLVFIDILGRVRPQRAPQSSVYEEDLEFMSRIRELAGIHRIAIIGVHHTNKRATDDSFLSTSGSQGLGGGADGQMTLRSTRGESEASLEIEHREFLHELVVPLVYDRTLGTWALQNGRMSGKCSEARQQILEALIEHGPMTPKRLAEHLQKNLSTITNLLIKMAEDRQVCSNNGVYYAMTVFEETA